MCNSCYQKARSAGAISIYKKDELTSKLKRFLRNIDVRCNYSKSIKYKWYGGRGIRNNLTLDDLLFLWKRDEGDKLSWPSIDRFPDYDGHYEIGNCRFIEREKNIRRSGKCSVCGMEVYGIKYGRCKNCRLIRRCRDCGELKTMRSGAHLCEDCRLVILGKCVVCAAPVTLYRGKTGIISRTRNKQFFCSKQHQGFWLGKSLYNTLRHANLGV